MILCRKALQYKALYNSKPLNFTLVQFAKNMVVMAIKISKGFGLFSKYLQYLANRHFNCFLICNQFPKKVALSSVA